MICEHTCQRLWLGYQRPPRPRPLVVALAAAQEDWAARMQGLTYKCPLPEDLKPPLDQLD